MQDTGFKKTILTACKKVRSFFLQCSANLIHNQILQSYGVLQSFDNLY